MRRSPRNTSFSSSLLDKIYSSIDGDHSKREAVKVYEERSVKKHSNHGVTVKTNSGNIEDEKDRATFRRACLIQKWMEKKVKEKVSERDQHSLPKVKKESTHHRSDPRLFSSSSSSSDSSYGGFSSSEIDSFNAAKNVAHCFSAVRPKSSRTKTYDHQRQRDHEDLKTDYEGLNNLKLKALKIYNNLKKAKQPISPGARVTSFLNSLLTNANAKKTKSSSSSSVPAYFDSISITETRSHYTAQASTCSSASSFSRSCLSKAWGNSGEKINSREKRTVRFCPVSVIVDEDCRPCGHKCIYQQDAKQVGRSSTNPRLHPVEQSKNQKFIVPNIRDEEEEEDNDDAASYSSSDLFELDHLAFIGNDRYCEELPVYETTHLDTNRVIANGLFR